MLIGFSTGSLALGNVRLGLKMVEGHPTAAIELSALRESELVPLVESLDELDLQRFTYISVHALSRLASWSESDVVSILMPVAEREWPIVVHPDIISDMTAWQRLGHALCLENMDKRKSTGRTALELEKVFAQLPSATLCFDIGHARQVDPTMSEAALILRRFGDRLQQIHLSLVDSQSAHEPLNEESLLAYKRISHLLPRHVPIILETPVKSDQIEAEMAKVEWLLN